MASKQEVGIPDRVKVALQEFGWICRSTIIWAKRSPMPESVTDRPCKSHEYVFLLSKKPRYFYDRVAVMEPAVADKNRGGNIKMQDAAGIVLGRKENPNSGLGKVWQPHPMGRNLRSVWSLSNAPYKGAHFATFPPKLVIPCIKAGTSEKGCCPVCGAPWKRLTKSKRIATRPGIDTKCLAHSDGDIGTAEARGWNRPNVIGNRDPKRHTSQTETTGWEPGCECVRAPGLGPRDTWEGPIEEYAPDPIPCTVLDPFLGSGTTAAVAEYLGRSWVGCELNPKYAELARERIAAGYVPPKESKKRKVKKTFERLQRTLFAG